MGKGEIAHIEQILLFPQCFLLNQIIVSPFVHIFDIINLFAAEFEKHKFDISSKWLRHLQIEIISNYRLSTLSHTIQTFNISEKEAF